MTRIGTLIGLALVALFGTACTQVRYKVGKPLACYADAFEPDTTDHTQVMSVLGPPSSLTRTQTGFAFLYEHVETLENQLGLSFEKIFGILGIDTGSAASSASVASLIRLMYAWETGEAEALLLGFDHTGYLQTVAFVQEDLKLGSTVGVSLIVSASPKVGSAGFKTSAEQFDWGFGLLDRMPKSLNAPQDLSSGQAGLRRLPEGFFAGQNITVPRTSETRREKKKKMKGR